MKRDINLLPRKKTSGKQSKGLIAAIIITIIYIILLAIGILIPRGIKFAKQTLNYGLEQYIIEMQPQVDEYEQLKVELDALRSTSESTSSFDFSDYDAKDALEIVQANCPKGVKVEGVDNTEMTLVIDIVAENNYQIAQFALELERSGHFMIVNIDGSTPADLIYDENEQSTGGNAVRGSIYLIYNQVDDGVSEEATEGDGSNEDQ